MIDEILGLPAHPLIVHAAVVFGPLLAGVLIAYALVPPFRKYIAWAVVGLGVVAPAALWLARLSGDAFLERQRKAGAGPEFAAQLQQHASFGENASVYGTALGVLAILLVVAVTAAGRRPSTTGSQILTYGIAVLGIIAAGFTLYYVIRAGHTGATNVWGV
ncbi:MAG TPA: DUF2231 domain-containing protein [Candidatus Limnocylindrales bacterium]|nr:DUF2231 domain-containing protein [Candidatus Limnocylindrales bacterium]